MAKKSRDIWIGIWVALIGIVFLMETSRIEGDSEGLVGPMLTPFLVSVLIIVFGGVQAVIGIVAMRKAPANDAPSADPVKPLHLAAVIAIGAGYIVLFPLIGYFFSTLIALALSMLLFRNPVGAKFAAIAILGALVYQAVFIDIMNIHDPAAVFSLKSIFR